MAIAGALRIPGCTQVGGSKAFFGRDVCSDGCAKLSEATAASKPISWPGLRCDERYGCARATCAELQGTSSSHGVVPTSREHDRLTTLSSSSSSSASPSSASSSSSASASRPRRARKASATFVSSSKRSPDPLNALTSFQAGLASVSVGGGLCTTPSPPSPSKTATITGRATASLASPTLTGSAAGLVDKASLLWKHHQGEVAQDHGDDQVNGDGIGDGRRVSGSGFAVFGGFPDLSVASPSLLSTESLVATSLERSLLESQWELSTATEHAFGVGGTAAPSSTGRMGGRGESDLAERKGLSREPDAEGGTDNVVWRSPPECEGEMDTEGVLLRGMEEALGRRRMRRRRDDSPPKALPPSPAPLVCRVVVKTRRACGEVSSARRRRLESKRKLKDASCAAIAEATLLLTGRPLASMSNKAGGLAKAQVISMEKQSAAGGSSCPTTAKYKKMRLLTKEEEVNLSKMMQEGLSMLAARKRVIQSLGREPTDEEWAAAVNLPLRELLRRVTDGERARERMIDTNLRLVISVAKRYVNYGLDISDLVQEGTIGLMRGVEKFDFTRGYKLSTYVHWWIRQAVTRAIADHAKTIRLPVHVHETMGRIRKGKSFLLSEGSEANAYNLSKVLCLPEPKVRQLLKVGQRIKSLDEELFCTEGPGHGTRASLMQDPDSDRNPWDVIESQMLQEDVSRLLSVLDPREREILRLHYGVGTKDRMPMTLENISHRYGVSRERVRQVETAAMRKLQLRTRKLQLEHYLHSACS